MNTDSRGVRRHLISALKPERAPGSTGWRDINPECCPREARAPVRDLRKPNHKPPSSGARREPSPQVAASSAPFPSQSRHSPAKLPTIRAFFFSRARVRSPRGCAPYSPSTDPGAQRLGDRRPLSSPPPRAASTLSTTEAPRRTQARRGWDNACPGLKPVWLPIALSRPVRAAGTASHLTWISSLSAELLHRLGAAHPPSGHTPWSDPKEVRSGS